MANWKLKVGMLFDSQEFEQGVQRVDKQIKVLDSELKTTQSSLKNFGTTSDSLKARETALTEKIDLQKTKVEGLKKAYDESVKTKGEDSNATQNLEIKLNNATTALNKMQGELKDVKEELKNQPSLLTDFSNSLDKLNNKLGAFGKKIEQTGTALTVGLTAPIVAGAKKSIDAIMGQIEQETKLTTIMKQRMNASDESINSIIKLTDAQQKLGIIEDDVQLAGAQQISTFLKQDSSVKTLLPAMNNLLAQQKGVNATNEDAVGIANMMGKVLEGNVGSLKRVGISFTEAEEKVLKYGNEEEKAAMLAKVINNNVGQMNQSLAATTEGKIKQVKNAFGELEEQIGRHLLPIIDKYLPKITDLINKFLEMDDATQSSILATAGFAAALGPGLIGVGKLTQLISTTDTKILSFAGSIGKGTEKILDFGKTTGIHAVNSLKSFEQKIASIGGIGEKISGILAPIGQKITGAFAPITNKIGAALGPMIQKVQTAFGKIGSVATQGAGKLAQVAGIAMKLVGPVAIIGLMLAGLGLAEQQFGTQIDQFMQIAIQKGPQLIQGFVDKVTEQLPTLINLGVNLMLTLVDVIIANVPMLINGAVAIITGLADGVTANIDTIIESIINVLLMLVNTIIDNLPLILESGLKILMALVDGIVNHIDQIIDAMINIIIRLIEVIADNLPLLIECGIKILVALITGLSKAIPKLIAAIPTIVSAIFKAFGDVDWSNIGKNIIDGLVAGLKAAKDLVVNSLTNIANGAIKAFKKLFGINSPSTLFKGYGYNIDKGLAIGIDDSIDTIDKSMSNLMDAVNIVPEGLDYNLNGISTPSAISRIASSTTNNNSKTVNVNLNIEHFENNKDEDVKQLMSKMAYLAKKEILGNGGVA